MAFWNKILYTPSKIKDMTSRLVHQEYSRLRSIANKRIQRLNNVGLGMGRGKPFPTIKDITKSTRVSIESMLADVSKFLYSDRTTVTGERKFLADFKKTMTDKGYGDLVQTTKDIYKMLKFMEAMREQYGDKVFDSGDALDVLQETQRLNIPIERVRENFEDFVSNINELESLPTPENKRKKTKKEVAEMIESF